MRQDLRRSQRRFLYSLVLTVIAIGAASWAYISYRAAEKAKTVAEHAQREARIATIVRRVSQAETEFKISPPRGLLLAVEALNASRRDQDTCAPQVTCVQFAAGALINLLSATGGAPLVGHEEGVLAVSFSADGRLLATAGDWTVNLWRIDQLKTPFAVLRNPSQIAAVSLSGDGKLLATAGFGAVYLWRVDEPRSPFHSFPLGELENMGPTAASFSPNGKFVLTVRGMSKAFLWRLDRLETPIAEFSSQTGAIQFASFTSDEKFIVTVDASGHVQRWRLDQLGRKQKPVFQADLRGSIEGASFSPDGKYLVIPRPLNTESLQSRGCLINLDDPKTWEDKPVAKQQGPLMGPASRAASFSADGKFVAIADDDGTVRLWRVDKTESPFPVLRGHEGPVYAASFSTDGKFIATGGYDRTARIWQVDQPTAIANHDRSLENWTTRVEELTQLARKTAGRNLTREEWSHFFPDEEYHSTFPP